MDVLRGHYSFDVVHDNSLVSVGESTGNQGVSESVLAERERSRATPELPCQAFEDGRANDQDAAVTGPYVI